MFDAKEMHRFNGKVFETQLLDLFMFTLREETEETKLSNYNLMKVFVAR